MVRVIGKEIEILHSRSTATIYQSFTAGQSFSQLAHQDPENGDSKSTDIPQANEFYHLSSVSGYIPQSQSAEKETGKEIEKFGKFLCEPWWPPRTG